MALGVVAAVVFPVVSLATGGDSPTTPSRKAGPRPAAALPLEAQVGELVLTRFNGTSTPAYVRRILRDGRATGVTLFAQNVASPRQVRALTRQLQHAARGRALVAVDQEGGIARRFPWAGATGQRSLATPAAARAASRATARELRRVGVNLNFAPVVDVAAGPRSEIRSRAFPGGAAAVSTLGATAVGAYRGSHVAPTAKHFPGFGRATAHTDDRSVTIRATRAPLASDLQPFRAAIAAGAQVVMVSHALYPAYDGAWIASQSRTIVTGLLRGRLGFGGVVATDSMEASAVLARSNVAEAAVRSVYAGCDLVLLTGRGSQLPVYRRMLQEARRSPYFRQRVAESAARVLELKRKLGLISG